MSFPPQPILPELPADGATGDDFNDPAIAFWRAFRDEFAPWLGDLADAFADYVSTALSATSTTSLAIGTGSKAFTVGTGLAFVAGQTVKATSAANIANWMKGTVALYAGGVLTVTVDTTGGSGTYADWQIGLAITGGGGPQEIFIPASAMTPRTTNGAAVGLSESATNKIMSPSLDFDQSTDEFAQFRLRMPKRWNEGTITAAFSWTASATGNVVWGLQAVAISDDDVLDAAFGTAQTVTDGVTATTDLMISAATSAITVGGSPADRDVVVFQVYRDADNASDTVAADAKLLGVTLTITTNAEDDS